MMRFGWNRNGPFCNGAGFGGFGMIGMMLGGLLLTALLIYGLVVLVRREQSRGYRNAAGYGDRGSMYGESPLAILDERYARGEIGDEEYARRKAELRKR